MVRSAATHVALEQTSGCISLFSTSRHLENESLPQLRALQQSLRYGTSAVLDPVPAVRPLLTLLKSSGASVLLKLAAFRSLQTYLRFNVLLEGTPSRASEALVDVIDSITGLRFDAGSEDLLQLQQVQTLHTMATCSASTHLTNEAAWHIIAFCVNVFTASSKQSALCDTAEKAVLDMIRFVFSWQVTNKDGKTAEGGKEERLPCALKVLGYFMGILQKHAADTSKSSSSTQQQQIQQQQKLARSSSSSAKLSAAVTSSLMTLDADNLELILALKALHAVVLIEGSLEACRLLLLECSPIASVLRDDLGKCLVLICAKRDYPIAVIQNILSLYMSLVATIGNTIRIVIECFMKQIYLKALHQTLGLLSANDDGLNGLVGVAGGAAADENSKGGKKTSYSVTNTTSTTGFSIEELEVIFEALSSQISDLSFVPSMFASFDCDPSKSDIIIPVVRYLSHCARYYLAASSPKELGAFEEVATICMDCYSRMLSVLSDRCQRAVLTSTTSSPKSTSSAHVVATSLRTSRQAKLALAEAAVLFVKKPELGLRYLQEKSLLPTPLTATSVAKFLRIAPGLPKESTGAYLGELGKDNPQYEGDGKDFHRDVLISYVQSFELAGQSVLNSMRIFLSAFRLPGEAQQIDRILVAFSEHCHLSCIECLSGILENSEVAYLLTFSIIMLNTDRHNQNIRHDRKMTMEQFVRNNTNYGADLKQTKPIPREYLEDIYVSISDFPIRTERNDISGAVTAEMWMDLQLQATICPEKGLMISTNFHPSFLEKLSLSFGLEFGDSIVDAHHLLTSNKRVNPLALSAAIYECSSAFDCDVVECLWQALLGVGVCPFLVSRMPPRMPDRGQPERYRVRETNSKSLRIGIDIMVVLLRVGQAYSMQALVDIVILLFAEFAGTLRGQVLENLFAFLSLDYDFVQPNRSIVISSTVCNGSYVAQELLPDASSNVSAFAKSAFRSVTMEEFVTNLLHSLPARAALGTLLQIVHNNPTYIGKSWPVVLLTLGYLRDSSLLPRQMVVDCDADLLPPMVRTEFEARLVAIEQKKLVQLAAPKKSSSLLSLQGLGEAFFGSAVESTSRGDGSKADNLVSNGKWDAGYEDRDFVLLSSSPSSSSSISTSTLGEENSSVDPDSIMLNDITGNNLDIADFDTHTFAAAFGQLRELVSACGVSSLISGTRFLTEDSLMTLLAAIVTLNEADASRVGTKERKNAVGEKHDALRRKKHQPLDMLQVIISNVCGDDAPSMLPSPATCSWLEMVLVDTSLRNRDRFGKLWPTLEAHYRRTLSGSDAISYLTERRIVGIFKIAERMISRESIAAPILALLGHLFISPLQASFKTSPSSDDTKPLSNRLLTEVSGQISAGMWRLLTTNVASLPLLGLEQWQVLFDIISMGASAGGYASIKAFEAMAWLLHEPRLRAEVPVFCVVGVKPLLCNNQSPISVSVGAVHLLTHLHTRLEVLVKVEDIGAVELEHVSDGDAPVLWESCWIPILRAMADGINDERRAVRMASVAALTHAISDRHALVVPAGVLVDILGDVVVPTVLLLAQGLVKSALVSEHERESEKQLRQSRDEEILAEMLGLDDNNNLAAVELDAATTPNGSSTLSRVLATATVIEKKGTTTELCRALTDACLRQLKKLSRYPSFDKLWLRLLHVLGYFLGAPHGFDHGVLSIKQRESCVEELRAAVNGAKAELNDLLSALSGAGVFKTRPGLLEVTKETISLFKFKDTIVENLH